MKAIVKLSEIKEKYPNLQIEYNKNGIPIFISIKYKNQLIGFNCEFISVSEKGVNRRSLETICAILKLPIPDIDSPDIEAGELIWRTFYLNHKEDIEKIKSDYVILYNICSDHEIFNQFDSAIVYD